MATLKQGILGGIKGKVGNVVGSSWKGIATIKAMPLSVSNPRTAGQVEQRTWFKSVTSLGSQMLASIIKPLWDSQAQRQSGYNLFIQANKESKDALGAIDFSLFRVMKGKMQPPTAVQATQSGKNVSVTVTNSTGDRYAMENDNIVCVVINISTNTVEIAELLAAQRGSESTVEFAIPIDNEPVSSNDLCVFVGYCRNDYTLCSDSLQMILS